MRLRQSINSPLKTKQPSKGDYNHNEGHSVGYILQNA